MKRVLSVLLLLVLLAPSALSEGIGAMELYDDGKEYFYIEEYGEAAKCFRLAGNYADAKLWAYYCEAIEIVTNADEDGKGLEEARARFKVLMNQSFRDSDEWWNYTLARSNESHKLNLKSNEYYGQTLVHDSLERFLLHRNNLDVLKTRDKAIDDLETIYGIASNLSVEEYYQEGMNAYYFEEYAMAADCFTAAGNYQDARYWRCYTLAISLVIDAYEKQETEKLSDAEDLFCILCNLGFENAEEWETYVKARQYEAMNSYEKAVDLYENIMVYDSGDRYINLWVKYMVAQ